MCNVALNFAEKISEWLVEILFILFFRWTQHNRRLWSVCCFFFAKMLNYSLRLRHTSTCEFVVTTHTSHTAILFIYQFSDSFWFWWEKYRMHNIATGSHELQWRLLHDTRTQLSDRRSSFHWRSITGPFVYWLLSQLAVSISLPDNDFVIKILDSSNFIENDHHVKKWYALHSLSSSYTIRTGHRKSFFYHFYADIFYRLHFYYIVDLFSLGNLSADSQKCCDLRQLCFSFDMIFIFFFERKLRLSLQSSLCNFLVSKWIQENKTKIKLKTSGF